MTVPDNTILAEDLSVFFTNLSKRGLIGSEKMAKNVLKNPIRALEIGANVGTAFASRSNKTASTLLPGVVKFYHTGKGI